MSSVIAFIAVGSASDGGALVSSSNALTILASPALAASPAGAAPSAGAEVSSSTGGMSASSPPSAPSGSTAFAASAAAAAVTPPVTGVVANASIATLSTADAASASRSFWFSAFTLSALFMSAPIMFSSVGSASVGGALVSSSSALTSLASPAPGAFSCVCYPIALPVHCQSLYTTSAYSQRWPRVHERRLRKVDRSGTYFLRPSCVGRTPGGLDIR